MRGLIGNMETKKLGLRQQCGLYQTALGAHLLCLLLLIRIAMRSVRCGLLLPLYT